MSPEEYLESLEYQDIIDLETMINDYATVRLRADMPRPDEIEAMKNLDEVIREAPKIKAPMFLYRQYEKMPELRQGGTLIEKAYFYGTTKKPSNITDVDVISVEVPKGTSALKLTPDVYVLARGLQIKLEPAAGGIISAVVQ